MLDDRDYMREPDHWKGGRISLTDAICFILVGVFLFQCLDDYYLHTPFMKYLALTTYGVKHGWVWQLITFQFLHANLVHLLGNLISFWWLGRAVEGYLGRQRFLVALFGCGVMGGILQGILMLIFPDYFGGYVLGASAGISGLLAIFALMDERAEILFYFVIPMRAVVLLYIFGSISLFFTVFPKYGGHVANAAHLGGILAGVAWVKLGWHRDFVPLPWENWLVRRGNKRANPPRLIIEDEASPSSGSSTREVDRILEKITAKGIESLTASERATLESARKQMNSK